MLTTLLFIGGALGMLVLALLCGACYQALAAQADRRRFVVPERLIAVNGRRWYLSITSPLPSSETPDAPTAETLLPTVVMDNGLAHVSAVWGKVQPEVATFARVVTYDRSGYGWSDPAPLPRTSKQVVDELRALLRTTNLQPPYLLVGHSFGGMNMLCYALSYPDEVSGLVLVDALAPQMAQADRGSFSFFVRWSRLQYRVLLVLLRTGILRLSILARGMDGGPGLLPLLPTRDQLRGTAELLAGVYAAAAGEADSLPASSFEIVAREQASGGSLNTPLIVLAHGLPDLFAGRMSPDEVKIAERIWREMQEGLAHLSPQGRLIVAEKSGHKIHLEQPELVIAAIREVATGAQ